MNTPDTPQTLYQKGYLLWQQQKANEAFQYFQQALALTEDRPFYLLAITKLLLDADFFQQGIVVLEQYLADTRKSSNLQVRLALFHEKLEQSESAISILRTCIEQFPDCVDAYTALAEIYGHLNKTDLSVDVLSSLMNQYPEDVEVHQSAASYLAAIGAEKEALKAYQLSLGQAHCDALVFSNVARLHYSLGDFGRATEYNLRAISKDANSAASYLGIATSKKFSLDDQVIVDQFKDSLNSKLNETTLTTLNFALGKIYDDLENYDLAFRYYETANQKRRKLLEPTYGIQAVKEQYSAIKSYFTRAQINQLQARSGADSRPIFIVGMPRSGTTLLERIFASDEGVFCAGEMETLDLLPGHIERSTQNRLRYPEVLSHLPREAMNYYCEQYLDSATAEYRRYRHVLDKNPLNFSNIGLIKALFPQAHIIHCTRDPLDNCLSLYFQYFAHKKMDFSYDLNSIAQYYSAYLDMMHHWSEQGLEILTIRYEDLVSDTAGTISRLGEFTSLDRLSLKSGGEMSGSIHTASVWQARQKIHGGSVNRWRHYQNQLADYRGRYPQLFE